MSDSLNIPTMDAGLDHPEQYFNNNAHPAIKGALAGLLQLAALTGGTVTLSEDEARNARMEFTGTLTSDLIIVVPVSGSARRFSVKNSTTGAHTLTVKTDAGGSTGSAVAQGATALLEHDGTNVYDVTGAYVKKSGDTMTDSLRIGTTTSTSTATPLLLDLGGTFSNAAGAHPKLKLYNDGSNVFGIGISSGQMDFIVTASVAYAFYCGADKRFQISGDGVVFINTGTVPVGNPPTGTFYIYTDPADNKLKAKGSAGSITPLANP
jgi:hypothetical protein